MRHEHAQRALGDGMDHGDAVLPEVRAHVDECEVCSGFERGAWRLRELTRFEVAPEVPDLTSRIMTAVRDLLWRVAGAI